MADRALRAVGWSFASSALGKLATVVIGVILARMLSPREFGVYAVAYAALRILVSLNDLGVSLAIVRWPGDPRDVAPTAATIAVFTSLTMYAACYLGAPAYASAMGAPSAAGVVRVLCLGVVLDGFASSAAGLLQRQFRQDLRLITDQANLWLCTAVSVALAWSGFGAMSLGVGRVAGGIASLIMLIRFSPYPVRFGFSPARARQVLRFALPVAASIIISFAVMNADQVVIGRFLGVTALGFFVLAANLSSWPVAVFAQPVRSVALAGFARLQHDPPAMRRAFLLVASVLTAIALPVCLMMSGAVAPLVEFMYGSRWLAAAPVLAWLGILAGLQIAFELLYDYFVVLALPRVVFILQLVWLLVLVPVLVIAARAGTVAGVVQAEIAVAAGVVLPWYLWELRKAGIRAGELARRLQIPVAGAMTAGVACWGVGRLIQNELAALALSAAAGAVIIALLILRLWPDLAAAGQGSAGPGLTGAHVPAGPAPGQLTAGERAAGELAGGELTAELPVLAPPAQAANGHGPGLLVPGPAPVADAAPGPPGLTPSAWQAESLAEQFFRWWDAMNPPEQSANGHRPGPPAPLIPGPAPAADLAPAADTARAADTVPGPPEPAPPEPAPPAATPESLAERFFRAWDAMNGPHPNGNGAVAGNGAGVAVPPPPEHNGSHPPQFRATAAALGWEYLPLEWPDAEGTPEP